MTRNKWIIIFVAAIVILGGLVALSTRNSIDVSAIDTNKIVANNTKAGNINIEIGDHVYGNTSGKVLLVEYGDIQCPSCGELHPQLKPLLDYYKESLSFVFRNFPLTSIHPNALAAATAAEAAGLQGKYWEMNNLLYDDQNAWAQSDATARTAAFKGYAQSLGLNADKFVEDFDNPAVQTKIKFDMAIGNKLNVRATPTVYLQGKEIAKETGNATNGDSTDLENAIRDALKAAGMNYPEKTYAQAQKDAVAAAKAEADNQTDQE
jgi:protein-disulfide isomerase